MSLNEESKNEDQNETNFKNNVILKNDGSRSIGDCHFRIRYCPYKNKYLIKDMGDGSGTFVKVEDPVILQSGTIICIGVSHIIVGLIYENLQENIHEN